MNELTTQNNNNMINWDVPDIPGHIKSLIENQIHKSIPNASSGDIEEFIYFALSVGLNPLKKQIYPMLKGGKLQPVTSIDGLRSIAHRTGEYTGCEREPIYNESGDLEYGKCTVCRNGNPFIAKVKFLEYRKTGKEGFMWSQYPETMILKVAEAHALRMAFPEQMSGVYTNDEMPNEPNRQIRKSPELIEYEDKVINTKEEKNSESFQTKKMKFFAKYDEFMKNAITDGYSENYIKTTYSDEISKMREYVKTGDIENADNTLSGIQQVLYAEDEKI